MKKLFLFIYLMIFPLIVSAEDLELSAKASILIETSTGKVLNETNADEKLHPASMTKVMTMLLIMEALESGKITLDEKVNISNNAASMGGSQVFLEAGSQLSVQELLKSIAIASANDAVVIKKQS